MRIKPSSILDRIMSDENQHWVPKFLIKGFAGTDGRVYCLDIHTDKVRKRPPKHVASDTGFNEFLVQGRRISFEDELELIETQAAPIIRRIASSRSIAELQGKEKYRVAKFMAAQSFRTEAFYKGLALGVQRQEFGHVFAQLWRSAFLVSDEIESRHWAVMSIEHDEVFYLGDHPVVLQRTENPSAGGELGFDVEGVEAFLPLTPTCALFMPCRSVSSQIISGYEAALWIHRRIRSATIRGQHLQGTNSDAIHLSQRVMRDNHALYNAFTTGVAATATSENVENLNYLQCAWAHAAVYSTRGDFTFAKKVFRQTPQYRKSIRTGLITVAPRAAQDRRRA